MTSYAQPLARAVALLVAEHDVTDVLAHFLTDGQEALGAAAAGLLVRSSSGELEVLTTTSHRVSDLEAYQAQQKTGPCADAVATGEYVFESDVHDMSSRWPGLTAYWADTPYQAVQAHPMRWHGHVLGAINSFFVEPVAESRDLLVIGQAFADMATLILLTPHEIGGSDIATRTRQALIARTIVEQAKGVLAYQRGIPIDEAYDMLLDLARTDGLTLSAAAAAIVRQASRTG
jgi:ANTAR domain